MTIEISEEELNELENTSVEELETLLAQSETK